MRYSSRFTISMADWDGQEPLSAYIAMKLAEQVADEPQVQEFLARVMRRSNVAGFSFGLIWQIEAFTTIEYSRTILMGQWGLTKQEASPFMRSGINPHDLLKMPEEELWKIRNAGASKVKALLAKRKPIVDGPEGPPSIED